MQTDLGETADQITEREVPLGVALGLRLPETIQLGAIQRIAP